LARAFRKHLLHGSKLTLVAGNHDAELGMPEVRKAILESLELAPDSPLEVEPWGVKRADPSTEATNLWALL
jgi:hypothetical protein